MNLAIVTGCNPAYQEIGELSWKNIQRYSAIHNIRCERDFIPGDYPREPSWAKLKIISRYLVVADCVLWVDADAMFMCDTDIRNIIKPAELNISADHNGINCGVMAWWNCYASRYDLDRIEKYYEPHPWFEQAALMKIIDRLDVHYIPKHIFNAYPAVNDYPGDVGPETIIQHWPGMTVEERLPLMTEAYAQFQETAK